MIRNGADIAIICGTRERERESERFESVIASEQCEFRHHCLKLYVNYGCGARV